MRIYKVNTPAGERLIQSPTKGQAIKHCVTADYTADVVGASEMLDLINSGKTVETVATKDTPAEAPAAVVKQKEAEYKALEVAPVVETPVVKETLQAAPAAFIPPKAVTAQTAPPVTAEATSVDVIQEQQQINPQAAAAAMQSPVLPPAAPVLRPAPVLQAAPTQGGPVDWEARENAGQ